MTKAVVVEAHGGPEVLSFRDVDVGAPGPGQIRVRQRAIGVNFVDIYQRTGLYPVKPPFVAGNEGAGEVVAVGPEMPFFAPGDRVVYQGVVGAYAEERLLPAAKAVPLPETISFEDAAAAMLKGTTAYYLLHRTFRVGAGTSLVWHAAAGGTGLIACQWAKALGAMVIGTVGSDEKAALAKMHGCDHVINYREENFALRVKEITGGKGVDVVYDGNGKDTFEASLDCLKPLGMMVSFGNASGPVAIPDLGLLARKGSLFVTRPTGAAYFATREDLVEAAAALFAAIGSGVITVEIGQRLPLAEAAVAQQNLVDRRTIGSTILLP
jgi:NADPH2:quinone reductase